MVSFLTCALFSPLERKLPEDKHLASPAYHCNPSTLCNALEIYWDEYADYPYFTDKEKMKKACDLPKVHGQWAAGTESLTIPSKGVLWFRVTYTFRLPPDKQWKVIFLESILYRKHKNPLLSLTTKTEWLCNTSSPAALLIFHTIKCY